MKNENPFNRLKDVHPILLNALLIVLAAFATGYIALLFIDVFTSHGQERLVPDVRNMTLAEAASTLDAAGLKWDISDSTTFDETRRPGTVLDQDPKANSYIKAIRTIYLKVNAMEARRVSLPRVDGMPMRQAVAMLQAMEFKHVTVDTIASPYKGLVLQFTVDGHNVAPGTSVSINSFIRLIVGNGAIDNYAPDSLLSNQVIDSINASNYEEELEQYSKHREQKDDDNR